MSSETIWNFIFFSNFWMSNFHKPPPPPSGNVRNFQTTSPPLLPVVLCRRFLTIAALKRHKTAKVCKSMHIECYLYGEVPEEERLTDVVTDTDLVPETDVVSSSKKMHKEV